MKTSIFPIYRPEPNEFTMSAFLKDFSTFLESVCVLSNEVLILGDFNIHLDKVDNSNVKHFLEILSDFNLLQHVSEPTHESGHILDLVISRPTGFVSNISVGDYFF